MPAHGAFTKAVCLDLPYIFDAWCSVVGAAGMRYSRPALGVVCVLSALIVWGKLIRFGEARTQKRFLKAPVLEEEFWRRLAEKNFRGISTSPNGAIWSIRWDHPRGST